MAILKLQFVGCNAKSPEFIFRTFEIGVSHRDVYRGVLCL